MDTTDRKQSQTHSRTAERRKRLKGELARYMRILREQGNAEKVILFGTLADGSVHEGSDIDLVIVTKSQTPFFQRIKTIRNLLQPQVATDIMVYTPEEFERLCAERAFFREEILAKGKILYERHR